MLVDEIQSITAHHRLPGRGELTAAGLEAELRAAIQGEVRFDAGSRALYATDGSNYRQVPIGVTCPRNSADVEAIVAACRRHGAPLLSRGGGTSLAGQCCNVAVMMDFSKYMYEVLEIDPDRKTRTRAARRRAGFPARRRRKIPPDIRARSGDSHALHAGRNGRQ